MSKTTSLKLFWVLSFIYISYFSAFGMNLMETQNNIQREYDDTFQEFHNIIKLGPEHMRIKIERKHWHEYDPSGVYQLVPYYMKVFPEDIETSRFIIQKQPFNGEWQLTEIYDKIWRRTIYPFPCNMIEGENESFEEITFESFDVLQRDIKIMKKTILNLEQEVMLKNKNITQINESLPFLEETIITKDNQIKNLNIKIHSQTLLFEEKIRFLKSVHFVKLKQNYLKNQKKFEEKFEKNIFLKEKQIHDLNVKVKNLITTNKNFKLEITNLKSNNDNSIKEKENQIHLQKKKFEEKVKLLKNMQAQVHELHAKVKALETPNENMKVEITDLKSKNDNLKLTNDGLKFQLQLLNEQIDTLNTEVDSFRKEKTNLAQKLTEENTKYQKLEFALKKKKNNTAFIKESESPKKANKKQKLNPLIEQKNITKVMENEFQDSLHTKDETNSKSFATVNQIDNNLKTRLEKILEQKCNITIVLKPSTNENESEKQIEKSLEKTKTKAPNDENIQLFRRSDTIKQIKGQQTSASEDMTTKHKKNFETNLEHEATTTVPESILVKNMNENNIKKDENILYNKCESEYKYIMLYATTMYKKLQDEWLKDYLNTIKYPEIMPKITYVLTNMDKLKMNLNFKFEFALMYWGCIAYFDEETQKVIMQDTENEIVKQCIYVDILEKLKNKYSKLGNNAMENIQDPKQRILFKCLLDNTKLFQVEKYRFEALLVKSGLREAAKEILEELKKRIEWLSDDSKNIFNKTQEKNSMVPDSTFVEENLAQKKSIHQAKKLNEVDQNIKNTSDKTIENNWENECKCVIFYAKKMNEKLESDWSEECFHAFKNHKIMSKINYFLERMESIKIDPNYQYEFVFIYWGALNYAEDQYTQAVSDSFENDILTFYSHEVNQTKLQTFWNEIGNKIYVNILKNMKMKYDMLLQNAKQNIQDSKQKILCDNFFLNPDLFEEERYEYEFLLLKRGHLQEGPKEILEVFKKGINLLSIDSKTLKNMNR